MPLIEAENEVVVCVIERSKVIHLRKCDVVEAGVMYEKYG